MKNKDVSEKGVLPVVEYGTVFLTGALLYLIAELIYRGYSHITMFFAGGLCFFLIYICEKHITDTKLLLRCAIYAFMITAVELLFGVVFNIILGFNVWDYSEEPFNLYGQICPEFVLVWAVLTFPAVLLCRLIRAFFEKSRKPMQ